MLVKSSKKKTPVVAIINKIDMTPDETLEAEIKKAIKEEPLFISAKTGEGLDKVKEALARKIEKEMAEYMK